MIHQEAETPENEFTLAVDRFLNGMVDTFGLHGAAVLMVLAVGGIFSILVLGGGAILNSLLT